MEMELSFHGGAGTVTGSRHLLTTHAGRILIDAGMFQGLKALRKLNWQDPEFAPESLDHLLLTHAHIDHSGYLPRLVKLGFRGDVHCTEATRDLLGVMLLDAAKIQEEDARYANKKGFSKHAPALPLYTRWRGGSLHTRPARRAWSGYCLRAGPGARGRRRAPLRRGARAHDVLTIARRRAERERGFASAS